MDLVITVAALIVAIYAVTPRERQLALLPKFSVVDQLSLAAVLAAALYLDYYAIFKNHGFGMHPPSWLKGLTPSGAIPLVLLVGAGVLWLRAKYARLSLWRVRQFHALAEEMLWNERHVELLALLEQHIRQLFRIAHSDLLVSRVRARLQPAGGYERMEDSVLLMAEINGDDPPKPLRLRNTQRPRPSRLDVPRMVARFLLRLLPAYEVESQEASDMIRTTFLNQPFIASLARYRPYLGITMLEEWSVEFDREQFTDLYLRELLQNPTSVLYAKISNNRKMFGDRYALPATNRLLSFLFSDARVAKELEVYRSIGEFVVWELDRLHRNPNDDYYNEPLVS
jgi:hypothetical protein